MNEPIITRFKNHGHTPDETGNDRDERGFLKCQKCTASAGTVEAGKICPAAEYVHVSVMRREINALMNEFGGISSGKKIRKKVNQMYGREVKRMAQLEIDKRLEAINLLVKPKPKMIPAFAWRMIQGIVLRDKINL